MRTRTCVPYARPKVKKCQDDQFYVSRYIFRHQVVYIYVKFYVYVKIISWQCIYSYMEPIFSYLCKNCHPMKLALFHTSRPGDKLLIDQEFGNLPREKQCGVSDEFLLSKWRILLKYLVCIPPIYRIPGLKRWGPSWAFIGKNRLVRRNVLNDVLTRINWNTSWSGTSQDWRRATYECSEANHANDKDLQKIVEYKHHAAILSHLENKCKTIL